MNKYKLKILNYGILSILYVLEYYEQKENYEECKLIIDAINEQSKFLDHKLPTKLTENIINEISENFKIWTKEEVIENHKYYSQQIIENKL